MEHPDQLHLKARFEAMKQSKLAGPKRRWMDIWDRFLFTGCDPRVVPVLRIGYAILILIQVATLWNDAGYWFSDQGVMQTATAQGMNGPTDWSLFFWLPSEPWVIQGCLGSLFVHAFLMLLGVYSRFQAIAIFVWLVSMQHRNPLIHDGEDTVFRIFAFIMAWLPLDASCSLLSRMRSTSSTAPMTSANVWALRLIQIEMTAIYASTALSKLPGETWRNGSALWYVSRMTDNFGRWISPAWFDLPYSSAIATYSTLATELFLPIGL